MRKISLIIFVLFFSLGDIHAGETPQCDIKDFSCYESTEKSTCLDQSNVTPWTTGNDLGALKPKCSYDPFTKVGIDTMVSCMNKDEGENTRALQDGVSPTSIGSIDGFRALTTARLLYRKRMNSIFACGIMASRSEKLTALSDSIGKKNKGSSTEIQDKMKKEKDRYDNLMIATDCAANKSGNNANETIGMMSRSTMKEYCKFTLYLDYLEANVTNNITTTEQTDATIGDGKIKPLSGNTDELSKRLRANQANIKAEREKARRMLPKAISTYREMDRTYIIHIMLTLIYDQYVTLRDQLDKYLVITGQTFEKAFNAMDARQR